jgi:hypothetical protein
MTPAVCLAAVLGSVIFSADGPQVRPAPIPERWLLRYAPEEMPPLPESFVKTTWNHRWFPRTSVGAWEEWVAFSPETATRRGTATITRSRANPKQIDAPALTRRTVPVAVYGRLVEYDGRLYTAGVGNWAHEQPIPTDVLDLGAAVELPSNVWYTAASGGGKDGDPLMVQEWRLEFAQDPRTEKEGKVKVFGFAREVAKLDGEDFVAGVRFERTKEPHEKSWKVKLIAPEGTNVPPSGLPVLGFDPDRNRWFIYDSAILDQMFPTLTPARSDAPKAPAGAPAALVQPPKAK